MKRESPNRREFLEKLGASAVALGLGAGRVNAGAPRRPNIVFVLADDLGYAELGCYGQRRIRTPNVDRLAADGVRFTDHYSGSPVCAPSRCSLLTGLHTGHAYIRDNDEMDERGDVWRDPNLEGQRPLLAGTVTVASLLQQAGYATAAIGKWGLGGPGSSGDPNRLGFDHFYGYLCQRVAHNYYPTHLWRDGRKERLDGNPYLYPHEPLPKDKDPLDPGSYARYSGRQYSFDLMLDDALAFIEAHRSKPFFLYFAPTIPHAALQVPADSLADYAGLFPDTPYKGDQGYLPHRTPRAAYAAMVSRLDRGVGRILSLLARLGLDEDTIVFFASDNGPTFNGGTDSRFFESAGPFRGLKASLYEGGMRVPLVARWPGSVPGKRVSAHASAFWDLLPTFMELAGAPRPSGIDGVSMVPELLGQAAAQKPHEYLYWEFQQRQAVRLGRWKAIRAAATDAVELYDLEGDVAESRNVAGDHLDLVRRAREIMQAARTESDLFPLVGKRKSGVVR